MAGLGAVKGAAGALANMLLDQPAMTHRFVVQIDMSDYNLGSWSRVSGLGVTWSKSVYRAGENNNDVLVPGNTSYQNIKLERAACADSATVQQWLRETSRDRTLLSGAVYMLDFLGATVISWELKEFFPIGWSIGEFNSSGAKPALETLELAHSGFLGDEGRL